MRNFQLSFLTLQLFILAIWNPPWLAGWPTPGNYEISPLAIVDGVTVPFNITFTYQSHKANDVPGRETLFLFQL